MLLVESANQNKRERILQVPLGILSRHDKFTTTLSLRGSRLSVQLNGRRIADTHLIPAPVPGDAMLEMIIYNRIRGTASADGIRMIYTPVFPTPNTTE